MLIGCKKDKEENPIVNNPPPPTTTETIIATETATIGANGGTVTLSDAATVTVAAGVLTADTKITFSKIGNENIFAGENRSAYEILGLPKGTKVKLTFPCPKGLFVDFLGVYNYDPVNYTGTSVSFAYDDIVGKITVDNYSVLKKLTSDPDYRRWIIEWGDKPEYGDKIKLNPVPYYEQMGGSCWATDATMLTKAYSPYKDRESETEIYNYLKAMNLNMDDGIFIYNFMKVLPGKFDAFSQGAGAKSECYINKKNLLKAIIKRLDENKPVVMYMPNYAHAVLAVGYRTILNQSGYDDYELVIHDSKGTNPPVADEGGMYTTRKWSWFLKDASATHLYLILFPDAEAHPDRALQTLSLPTGNTGVYFEYYKVAGGSKGTISLNWDKDAADGYKWTQTSNVFETLPKTVKNLNLKLKLYNADLSGDQNTMLNVKITNNKKGKTTFQKDYPVTLSTTKNPYDFNLALDTSEWLENYGDTTEIEYYIQTRLMNKGFYQDGWAVKFKIKGAKFAYSYVNNAAFSAIRPIMTLWSETFKANVGAMLSGDKFRVMRDQNNLDKKGVTVNVPPMPANVSAYNFNLIVTFSDLILDPPITDAEAFLERGSWRMSGNTTGQLDNSGVWTVPITLEKDWNYKSYVVIVWPKIKDNKQGTWETTYGFEIVTVTFVFDK